MVWYTREQKGRGEGRAREEMRVGVDKLGTYLTYVRGETDWLLTGWLTD